MKSLIVQSDLSIILPAKESYTNEILDKLIKFAEIKTSPDMMYILQISSLSIWNAIAMGVEQEFIFETLNTYSKHALPSNLINQVSRWYKDYGVAELETSNEVGLYLLRIKGFNDKKLIRDDKNTKKLIVSEVSNGFLIKPHHRGEIKHALMKLNISVHDKLGLTAGKPLVFQMREYHLQKGFKIEVRDYQEESSRCVYIAGCGTVVLPCGSGKTPTGLLLMILAQKTTLIVTNSEASVLQWKQSLLNFTTLREEDISCYTKDNKEVASVTICTYSMLAYKNKEGNFPHFDKLIQCDFGVLICDEVHLMPAAMFRVVASFQASIRLALTATFVREDGKERDIFTLIGPKRYDKPWKDLEARGYIAKVNLQEVRVPMTLADKERYLKASTYQEKLEIAVMSENKIKETKELLRKHANDKVLIIGQSTAQLEEFSRQLGIKALHGKHSFMEREKYYDMMRKDEMDQLITSSIANAALDIPSINVVIQISFLGGSRNEEAQRVGRSSRPKEKESYFYTLVSKDTVEEGQNFNRKIFLTNEGYKYGMVEAAS